MTQFYAEILRGVGFRDNNFKPLASNDPATATISWTKVGGPTATSDGDLLTLTNSNNVKYVYYPNGFNLGLSTTTYPYLVIRAKSNNNATLSVSPAYPTSPFGEVLNLALTPTFQTYALTMLSGKSLSNISLNGQNLTDNFTIHYVYVSSKPPIQLSQKDLISGTVTGLARGDVSHAEFRLNNRRGKFVADSSSISAIGYGDHLHVYLPRQFDSSGSLYHAYGGYVEYEEPNQPGDEMFLNSRGFGLALAQTIVQNQPTSRPIYNNQTPRQLINDFIDNHVNNSNKNGLGISSNYQITRSFVQDIGSAIGLYIVNSKTVADTMREISDLTVSQGTPATFWVDPAENLHWVPLGAQGAANWTTDPIPANYGTALAIGSNILTYRFRRDVQSLHNRVHYFSVAQFPGISDAWTENNSASWGAQAANGDYNGTTTATFSNENSIVAIGNYSVKCLLTGSITAASKAMFYPSAKNLGIDISRLGSVNAPPIFDFYLRLNQGANSKNTTLGKSPYIFFGSDTNGSTMTDYFKYNLISDGNTNPLSSILGIQGINNATDNYYYHIMVPIGPYGGIVWNPTPIINTVAPALYSGTSIFELTKVGSPDWANINYVGLFWQDGGGGGANYGAPFYFDGWRILGGRYYIAYDNRANAYKDMREIQFYDPIVKSDTDIQNFALSELKRLWNPIVRGPATIPIAGDAYPEQQVQMTVPSANYSNTYLRITGITHHIGQQAMLTEFALSDDFTNTQMLDQWKLPNALLQMGENAFFSREIYDLKTSILDPSFIPILIHP